jgi:signal peptidase II
VEPPADTAPLQDASAPGPATGPEAASGTRGSLFWWIVAGVVAADQATKALLRAAVPLYDSRPVVPGFLDLVHVRNEGVAFGLLNQVNLRNKWLVTTGLALLALTGVAYFARHVRPEERLARAGLSLILGGALGNLMDRLTTGYVVDFVDVYWGTWHFWAFNVADASITVGAILVFADLLLVKRHASHSV